MNTMAVLAADTGIRTGAGIIAYIIIGGLAGWIASKFMGRDAQMGILLNIVVGVVGAFLAGFLLSKLFGVDVAGGGYWFTFFIALLGAVILLFILKLVTGNRGRR